MGWVSDFLSVAAPVAGAYFGGPVGALVGSSIGGMMGQRSANEQNMALSRDQMDFQERMSSTAYQRATADMQAAGLNPMLAYSQGGASSPMGSMPQVQNTAAAASSSAAQVMGLLQGLQSVDQSQAQAEMLRAEAAKLRSETYDLVTNTAGNTARVEGLKLGNLARENEVSLGRTAASAAQMRHRLMLEGEDEDFRENPTTGYAAEVQRLKHERDSAISRSYADRDTAEGIKLGLAERRALERFYSGDIGGNEKYLRLLIDAVGTGSSALSSLLPFKVPRLSSSTSDNITRVIKGR